MAGNVCKNKVVVIFFLNGEVLIFIMCPRTQKYNQSLCCGIYEREYGCLSCLKNYFFCLFSALEEARVNFLHYH